MSCVLVLTNRCSGYCVSLVHVKSLAFCSELRRVSRSAVGTRGTARGVDSRDATRGRGECRSDSPAERSEADAWARIRTWEPLREGILSPSPLTGLGYPRAAAQRPRSVKPFPSSRDPGLPTEAFSCEPASGPQRGVHGPILHEGILRRTRRSPECGPGMGKESRGHRREDRPYLHGSQRVVPSRHSRGPGRGPRRRARGPRGLQVRRDLRGLDATRERGEGLPRTRARREDPIPGLDAEGHGPHGPAEPHHPTRATGSEGVLAAAQNAITATRRTPSSRTPSRKAVATNKTVQVCDPMSVTLSGPGTRKWLTIPYTKEAPMRTTRSAAASGGLNRKMTRTTIGPIRMTPRMKTRSRPAGRI